MKQHRIVFLPGNKTGYFDEGTSVRDAALELGIGIESSCGGLGSCGECRVIVKEGIKPPAIEEEALLKKEELDEGVRLSCKTAISDNIVCFIPEDSQSFDYRIMTEGRRGTFPLNPGIKKVFIKVPEPELNENYFDFDKLLYTLRGAGYEISDYDFNTIRNIPHILRDNNFRLTCVTEGTRLLSAEPGDTTGVLYGVALDIGTTTLAARLLNLNTGGVCAVSSALNPQQAYGADVISRINYIINNSKGLQILHDLIIARINAMIEELCTETGIENSSIYKITVAGNTIMRHIAMNVYPGNIAFSPYVPVIQRSVSLKSKELGININSSGTLYFLPDLGSYVGSDITGVLTVLDLEKKDDISLVVDIGTNGEIVLGSKKRILCCASPAGPAWEGAGIEYGMRAARGAIERARISNGELKLAVIGNVSPRGICGSGLHDLIIEFIRAGLIDKSGRIPDAGELPESVSRELRSRIVPAGNGTNNISVSGSEVLLTQKDVREVQLAKAAIAAGIAILIKELDVEEKDIKEVYVAGAFGNHLKGEDAIETGLLPNINAGAIRFIGNAALAGAEAVLLSEEARQKAEGISQTVEYIGISGREDFQDIFVSSMFFPE